MKHIFQKFSIILLLSGSSLDMIAMENGDKQLTVKTEDGINPNLMKSFHFNINTEIKQGAALKITEERKKREEEVKKQQELLKQQEQEEKNSIESLKKSFNDTIVKITEKKLEGTKLLDTKKEKLKLQNDARLNMDIVETDKIEQEIKELDNKIISHRDRVDELENMQVDLVETFQQLKIELPKIKVTKKGWFGEYQVEMPIEVKKELKKEEIKEEIKDEIKLEEKKEELIIVDDKKEIENIAAIIKEEEKKPEEIKATGNSIFYYLTLGFIGRGQQPEVKAPETNNVELKEEKKEEIKNLVEKVEELNNKVNENIKLVEKIEEINQKIEENNTELEEMTIGGLVENNNVVENNNNQ